LQRKLEETKREELLKAELEEQRVAKLNALKETTPYAQTIANIAVRSPRRPSIVEANCVLPCSRTRNAPGKRLLPFVPTSKLPKRASQSR
jgi:hypothetical protein